MDVNETENGTQKPVAEPVTANQYKLKTFQSSMNLLSHILIGIVVGGNLMFAFSNGLPVGLTAQHVTLCVLGYQLLMAESILSLSSSNGWSSHLKLVDKRRAHWILQILGSGLALAGSFILILAKNVHWNTLHGQFGLVALVFTTVSLVNGLSSLWAYELSKFVRLPANLSKLTHICFGIVAFAAAGISLCYGMDKGSFKAFYGTGVCYALMAFTACFTVIIIIDPFITFFSKLRCK